MLLAALQQVEKAYGDQVVLEDATLELRDGSRTALIGRNGAGKTTVLRLLMRLEVPDKGSVYRGAEVTAALLEQDPTFDDHATVGDVAEEAFADLERMQAGLEELEVAGLHDPERYARWERLHETFERRGGYARRARRDAVLDALGFRGREGQAVRQLSGGERTRLGLARLLMAQPDVLLLDEPTNHLDIDMRGWLEGYLGRYPGAALIVSHDRAFLDGACDRTAEVGRGRLQVGDDAPTAFRAARAEERRIQEATRANQEKEHARLETAAAQMKQWAGQNAKLHRRAKAMERRVERYARGMVDAPEGPERTTRFGFDCDPSGEIVLSARHLTKRFERTLFEDVSLELRQGQRIALVGPNGAGKTTFLRLLLGEAASDDPRAEVRTGARVRLGYYDQDLRGVDPDATLIEEMIRMVGDVEAHNLLGRFLFPFDAQYKRVRDLSGGERARLALLKLTLGRYNLLVLDEPTNHLDLEMIEALEGALRAYQGTLLLVSHDRRFLEALIDEVWEVRDGRFEAFEGDWAFYQRLRRRRDEQVAAVVAEARAGAERSATSADPGHSRGPSRWKLERMRDELEQRVATLERELDHLAGRLAAPTREGTDDLIAIGERHAALEQQLIDVMAEWEDVTERLGAG
ncbi:MAG: ABC-F family ATP-binding cassette domain-containing protein [Deinococcales bacterium]